MQTTTALNNPFKSSGKITPYSYQEEAISSGVDFFQKSRHKSELQVICTAGGKSVVCAIMCERLEGSVLVLQPTKEILVQNYNKFIASGGHAGIYSASVGRKDISRVTFATLGSIHKKAEYFKHFRQIIIDEAHLNSDAKGGMLVDFLSELNDPKVLGMTATPYRLYQTMQGPMLKFITRTKPKIFQKLGYYVQMETIKDMGKLADLKYYSVHKGFNRKAIKLNSTGSDFSEDSMRQYYDTINFKHDVLDIVRRVNKQGRGVLCFMPFVADAEYISSNLEHSATVHGKTPKKERERIEKAFKAGRLKSVINCNCFSVGFDYPELDAVVIAKPMRSLSVYTQMVGRAIRQPIGKPTKEAWVIDCCQNLNFFGKVEDIRVDMDSLGLPCITGSGGRLLTGVPLTAE
jgi:DNA repair protein RadD